MSERRHFISADHGTEATTIVIGYEEGGTITLLDAYTYPEHEQAVITNMNGQILQLGVGIHVCLCGHPEDEHFRGTGSCLYETPTEVWACACGEFVHA